MTGAGELVEVQGTAEGAPFSRAQLDALLDLATPGIAELTKIQQAPLASRDGRARPGSRSRPTTPTSSASSRGSAPTGRSTWVTRREPRPGRLPRRRGDRRHLPGERLAEGAGGGRGARAARRSPTTPGSRSTPSGGEPGPRSARFAGEHATDEENLAGPDPGDPGRAGGRPDAPGTGAWPRWPWPDGAVVHAEGDLRGNASHDARRARAASATTRSSCRSAGT